MSIKKFRFVIIAIVILLFAGIITFIALRYQNTSNKRLENKYENKIDFIYSTLDKDCDAIDDNTDILQGAIDYISSKPKYKSKYYKSGYPDDEYGVCTDVVANALKSAGYDLQKLVQDDIEKNFDDYNISEADANIDFRRVSNLKIFFANNSESLTTDVSKIEEWQGGDIVIFEKHIGIVSDRRNKNGVPYVIHHNDVWQTSYEQDILEKREDIVAHYRGIQEK